ncbi:PREDICTED: venom acid phosphatase Acph-1-like [Dinoponera quadriceps]|uniref:acid phosphatase n=1 Tax=Dinoponera quadriceps TaxID=609295 RepID=A0A6P3X1Q1_DINQU|nr:PREDICTED: venom acid phosphatase Acph-1-like [Dinoponera quadriceps]
MRHGERTPLLKETYPNDPYKLSDYELLDFGQLTNKGKMTEYRLGTMLRHMYGHFLGSIYHPRDVYAISTDIDRTKLSLELTLAGLYPPHEAQQWHPDVKWLGIPIHYTPQKVDIVMKPQQCPVYKAALKEVRNRSEVRDQIAPYHDFFEFLSEKTGLTITEPIHVYDLSGGLIAQRSMNLSLPEWCTDEVYQKIEELILLEYDLLSYTTELKRLNGGFLVKSFINNMNPRNGNKPTRKIYIYSGHEINIASFARAHNITDPIIPNFGSAFIVEKLRDEKQNFYVRIHYWTGLTQQLITRKLEQCDEICPMDTYLKLMRAVIPSDAEASCLWDNITKEEMLQLHAEKLYLN